MAGRVSAGGGGDAHLGQHAAQDHTVDGVRSEDVAEVGAVEAVVDRFSDDHLAWPLANVERQVPAGRVRLINRTRRPIVLQVDDENSGRAATMMSAVAIR